MSKKLKRVRIVEVDEGYQAKVKKVLGWWWLRNGDYGYASDGEPFWTSDLGLMIINLRRLYGEDVQIEDEWGRKL